MKESVARNVVLMSVIETSDPDRRILSDEDRHYASRSATELTNWAASEQKQDASPELFLEKRAEQVIRKVAERYPAFSLTVAPRHAFGLIGIALPLLAFLIGFLVDRIADPHRVDLLSPPLLLILCWNLVVYVGLLLLPWLRRSKEKQPDGALLTRLSVGKMAPTRKLPQALAVATTRFISQWIACSQPLTAARVKRVVHLSAASIAAGAVLSLYARGIVTQYRVGWESTFLNAEQVHALLSLLFAPAIALLQIAPFSLAEVSALAFSTAPSPASGARWVHLYAATLLLLVILPRLVLALLARWKESRLARNFPIDLSPSYFRKLTQGLGSASPAMLRIFPYSFTVDESRQRNLQIVAQLLLGEKASVMLRPSAIYGDSPQDALGGTAPDSSNVAVNAILFNLSATPEQESHGEFIDHLARIANGQLLVLIDESLYLERLGEQPDSQARIRQRSELWRQFCTAHQARSAIINLKDPSARAAEIDSALDTVAAQT
ncbi:DUF2868 domain-containing protein [Lacisediminimonas sp.]|uniref:DUF2868 domain-containing protein n=1 Tax=Lacisediminimonas sp. TaxID=3060582 RepID=UPI00271F7F83|nr:DUF2868 domain-containing protein [Lacisediminimonas sp.]MDO8298869.1 DUF2868 domain-containing protein [Lacisediminimonas sp.]